MKWVGPNIQGGSIMTISEPKFRVGQHIFYDGKVREIKNILGYQIPDESREIINGGWSYKITGGYMDKGENVMEYELSGDINEEYQRMQNRVLSMKNDLDKMLQRYHGYLLDIDRLINKKD